MQRKISYNMQIILLGSLLLIFVGITLGLIGEALSHLKGNLNGTLLVIIAGLVLIGIAWVVFERCMKFVKGDDGEMNIKYILDGLEKEGFYYLSDVMVGEKRGNIDIVVIGKTGIWAIEVKNYKKREIVRNQYLQKDISQTKWEIEPLQEILNIPVTPVLVFANPNTKIHLGMTPQNGVYVIGKKWLPELLTKNMKHFLSIEQCLQIKDQLKIYSSRIN